ncbi:MAG: lysozyme [Pseudomonadota bacterium]
MPWPILLQGVALIASKETLRLKAYRCPAGKWTCGWGETDGVGPTTVWTREYADQRFCDSLTHYTAEVRNLCTVEPSAHQLAAMVSLAYNIGLAAFAKSSVLRLHNAGDPQAAARAFGLWNKYRDPKTKKLQVADGLTSRRLAEAALYLEPDEAAPQPMPQAVAEESKLAASPIAQAGTVTLATGVVSALAEAREQAGIVSALVDQFRHVADQLHMPPGWLLPAALVLAGGAVVYWRWRQRREGWA